MPEQRTYAYPLCDRGKPHPNQGVTKVTPVKPVDTVAKSQPKAKANQRDDERGREE